MSDDDRRRAAKQLLGCIGVAVDEAAVKKLTGNLERPAAEQGNRKEACSVKRLDRRAQSSSHDNRLHPDDRSVA
jgi:hypothetical protein